MYAKGARSANTWMYHFDHVISFGADFWIPSNPICVNAVCHSEELPYIWQPNVSSLNASFTPAEAALSQSMQSYWSSMAHTGAPSSAAVWPPLTMAQEQAMKFHTGSNGGPPNSIDLAAYKDKCSFWEKIGYKWVLEDTADVV